MGKVSKQWQSEPSCIIVHEQNIRGKPPTHVSLNNNLEIWQSGKYVRQGNKHELSTPSCLQLAYTQFSRANLVDIFAALFVV